MYSFVGAGTDTIFPVGARANSSGGGGANIEMSQILTKNATN